MMTPVDYKSIITPLINRYDYLIDNSQICDHLPTNLSFGDLVDFVNDNRLYTQVNARLNNVSCSNETEFRRLVLDTTFNILDNNEFINADMRTVYENEFKYLL